MFLISVRCWTNKPWNLSPADAVSRAFIVKVSLYLCHDQTLNLKRGRNVSWLLIRSWVSLQSPRRLDWPGSWSPTWRGQRLISASSSVRHRRETSISEDLKGWMGTHAHTPGGSVCVLHVNAEVQPEQFDFRWSSESEELCWQYILYY